MGLNPALLGRPEYLILRRMAAFARKMARPSLWAFTRALGVGLLLKRRGRVPNCMRFHLRGVTDPCDGAPGHAGMFDSCRSATMLDGAGRLMRACPPGRCARHRHMRQRPAAMMMALASQHDEPTAGSRG